MPDLDLATADGPTRVFTLLNDAEGYSSILANQADSRSLRGQIMCIWSTHSTRGMWELPVLGEITPPEAVLDQTRWLRRLGRRHRGPRAASCARLVVRILVGSCEVELRKVGLLQMSADLGEMKVSHRFESGTRKHAAMLSGRSSADRSLRTPALVAAWGTRKDLRCVTRRAW